MNINQYAQNKYRVIQLVSLFTLSHAIDLSFK